MAQCTLHSVLGSGTVGYGGLQRHTCLNSEFEASSNYEGNLIRDTTNNPVIRYNEIVLSIPLIGKYKPVSLELGVL